MTENSPPYSSFPCSHSLPPVLSHWTKSSGTVVSSQERKLTGFTITLPATGELVGCWAQLGLSDPLTLNRWLSTNCHWFSNTTQTLNFAWWYLLVPLAKLDWEWEWETVRPGKVLLNPEACGCTRSVAPLVAPLQVSPNEHYCPQCSIEGGDTQITVTRTGYEPTISALSSPYK